MNKSAIISFSLVWHHSYRAKVSFNDKSNIKDFLYYFPYGHAMTIQLEQYQSGHYQKGYEYRFFLPSTINDEWVWQAPQINLLLEKAAVKLGELNSFARLVPNIDLFIQLHVTKEAVVSSRIEGTQTNIQEAVLPESEILPEHRNDWREVQN